MTEPSDGGADKTGWVLPMDGEVNHPRKPRRRWYQYSLRSLLVLTLLVSVGMSYVAVRMQRARRQKEAVEAIRACLQIDGEA